MRSVKKYITPIDMEIIYRAYRSVWTELNQEESGIDPAQGSRTKRQSHPQAGGSCS